MRFRLALSAVLFTTLVGCVPRWKSHVQVDKVPLGKVVVYRNGVAYYERRAQVKAGKLTVRVPRDRVDDFLKSLTVVDARTQKPLPVTFPRRQADDAPVIDMQLDVGGTGDTAADVVMTYVTDSAAWKPSYRLVLDGDKTMLESWAVVDNLSGEDWKDVVVGVGSSSAMSFRYDLWSVRTVEREQLAADEQFAVAPPNAISPYGGVGGSSNTENLLVLDAEEIRDVSNVTRIGGTLPPVPAPAPAPTIEPTSTTYAANPTGNLAGRVVDKRGKHPMIGATIAVTGPAMIGEQAAITDEDGRFLITGLPPGVYEANIFYNSATFTRTNVLVELGKQSFVQVPIDDKIQAGETIVIEGRAPIVDQGSTKTGITIDQEYTKNIPVPGRTFEGVLGAAAGSQGDSYGVAFSGSSSAENYYVADGNVVARDPVRGISVGDEKLSKIIPALIKNKQYVVVEGYAAPGEANAEARSLDRANVVRNQLIDGGVSPGRVRAIGKGAGSSSASVQSLTESAPSQETAAGPRRASDTSDEQPVGESHFNSTMPMTVTDGTSAMVSVLRATTSGREVYLYDGDGERGNTRFAFKSVRLTNPTDSTLEAGPITVYGAGRYIGEGLTEPIAPHAAVVVPYALDRQIVVDRTLDTSDELSKLVTVQRGILTAEVQHVRTTSLVVTSRLRVPSTVYVRHPIEPGWVMLDQPLPTERIGDSLLLAVELAPGESRTVELREATPMTRQMELGATDTLDLLNVFVKSERPTDKLREQLQGILAVHRQLFDTVDRIASLRDRQHEYRVRAVELEQQIASLRKVKTAASLSRELATKAAEISSRLQSTTIAIVDAQEQVMLLRVEFQDALAELHLPDALSAVASAP